MAGSSIASALAPDAAWVTLVGPIGTHDDRAIRAAAEAMTRDGLLEIAAGRPHAPLEVRLRMG